MKKFYCLQCLREHPWDERQCPVCGQQHGKERHNPRALDCGTIVHGRYLVGLSHWEDQQCLEYPCIDLLEEKKKFLLEYVPRNAVLRNGNQVRWKNGEAHAAKLCSAFLQQNPGVEQFRENETAYTISEISHRKEGSAPPKKSSTAKSGASKPSKSKTCRTVGAAIAAMIVLFLAWCGVWHLQGNQAMKNENYLAAISAFGKDPLFSKNDLPQAMAAAAEEAFSAGNYAEAAEWFLKLGEDCQARYSDSLYEQAKELIKSKDYTAALDVLSKISTEKRAAEQIGVAQLAIAEDQYKHGKTDEAIQTAKSIQDTTYANVTGFLNKVYSETAFQCLDAENLSGAISAFQKCSGMAEAEINAFILEKIEKKEYVSAAKDAKVAVDAGTTTITRKEWQTYFDSFMSEPSLFDEADPRLAYTAAKKIIGDPIDFNDPAIATSYEKLFDCGDMIDRNYFDMETDITLKSMNDLYAQCGTAADGKILVVIRTRNFSDKATNQLVSLAAMENLPAEFYPSSLAEVEYIAIVDYNYSRHGSYTKGTVGAKENGKVEVLRMPDKKQVSVSKSRKGSSPPSSFYYYVAPPEWKSGGAPNMGKDLYNALLKLM